MLKRTSNEKDLASSPFTVMDGLIEGVQISTLLSVLQRRILFVLSSVECGIVSTLLKDIIQFSIEEEYVHCSS